MLWILHALKDSKIFPMGQVYWMKNYISGYQVRTVSVLLAQISNDKEMLI